MAKELTFSERFGNEPTTLVRSPGRVNLIGEHTEYNQGYVLPAAIDRYTKLAAAPNTDKKLRVYSERYSESIEINPTGYLGLVGDAAHWGNYVRGATQWLHDNGSELEGADVLLWGDLPVGAGLAASSSLLMGFLAGMATLSDLSVSSTQIAQAAQEIENNFIGIPAGLADPIVISMAASRSALFIDCRSMDTTDVPLNLEQNGLSLIVVNSGINRDLDDGSAAKRRKECEAALGALKVITYDLNLQSLRDIDTNMLSRHGSKLYPTLYKRARHVITENERVLQTMGALAVSDMETVGELMNESHESLRSDFEVSNPFIDRLVELAQEQEGVLGSKLTGTGFGGCTVNLVKTEAIRDFDRKVVRRYAEETSLPVETYMVRAVGGLEVERL